MMTPRTVLIATAEARLRSSLVAALGSQAYEVVTAATFAEARALLAKHHPDVLVTTVRMQEYNGIHLAIISRRASAETKTIVIGYADPVLESEARQAGAIYLTSADPDDVVAAIEATIHRQERKWPRARTNITARAANQIVRLIDLSYGGFRIELPPGNVLPDHDEFDLMVGPLRVSALPVWMKQQTGNERIWCGATVAGDGESNPAWREFVDGALGGALSHP